MYQWELEFRLGSGFLFLALLLQLGVPQIVAFCIAGLIFCIGIHSRTAELIRMEGKKAARNITYIPDEKLLQCIAAAVIATYSLSYALMPLWLAALVIGHFCFGHAYIESKYGN